MTGVWCVRADFGRFTPQFPRGHCIGIGFIEGIDLTGVASREDDSSASDTIRLMTALQRRVVALDVHLSPAKE